MKKVLLLVLLIFLAGCVQGEEGGGKEKKPLQERKETGKLLKVEFEDLPQEIKAGEKIYFRIKLRAEEDLSNVEFSFTLPRFESNCNGRKFIGDMKGGEIFDMGCYLIAPEGNGTYEGRWSTKYSLEEREADLKVTVYESSAGRSGGSAKSGFSGIDGTFSAEPSEVVNGEKIKFHLEVSDENLVRDESCWCTIEEAEIRMPVGFTVVGLENWRKIPCDGYSCYRASNLQELNEEFYASIGVSETRTFDIKAVLRNVWKGESGKVSVKVI